MQLHTIVIVDRSDHCSSTAQLAAASLIVMVTGL